MSDYVPTDWVDNVTPVDAARMDHLEAGVDANADAAIALDTRLDVLEVPLLTGGRLFTAGKLITDWNAATENGFYRAAGTAANKPVASVPLVGVVIVDSANFLVQIVAAHNDAQTAAPRRWIRTRLSGTWGAWYSLDTAAAGGARIDYENAWAAGTNYQAGDVVIHNGVEYLSVNDSIGQTPPAVAAPAPGVISLVTALPSSPFDGQEVIFTDSLTSPTYTWRLRYVAAKATNKWVFVGGAPLIAEVLTSQPTVTTLGAYMDLATVGPSITVPVAGSYVVTHGYLGLGLASLAGSYMSFAIGAAAAVDTNMAGARDQGTNAPFTPMRQQQLALAAGTALVAKYKSAGAHASYSNRHISALPVAVAG